MSSADNNNKNNLDGGTTADSHHNSNTLPSPMSCLQGVLAACVYNNISRLCMVVHNAVAYEILPKTFDTIEADAINMMKGYREVRYVWEKEKKEGGWGEAKNTEDEENIRIRVQWDTGFGDRPPPPLVDTLFLFPLWGDGLQQDRELEVQHL
eukprot:15308080-Ditylum_brightwellii.AAC.1